MPKSAAESVSKESADKDSGFLTYLKEKAKEIDSKGAARVEKGNLLAVARNQLFFDQLEEVTTRLFSGKITPAGSAKTTPTKGQSKYERHLVLSDLHFGSALDSKDDIRTFGPVEEARRLASVVGRVCNAEKARRKETELVVHLLGDIIENQLHDPRVGEPLAVQTCAAIHLLSQAIGLLASEYKKVNVNCTPGNHGRFKSRHPERAVFQKWDSLETVIYYALKNSAAALKNVTFSIPKTPFYVHEAFGTGMFFTHGDTVLHVGNPGKSIPVSNIEKQVANIKGGLAGGEKLGLFVVGHVHVGSMVNLSNGETLITNGALVPSNSFAISLGSVKGVCGQTTFEVVKGNVVKGYDFLRVDDSTDKDKSLDKLIKPFNGDF